MTDKLSATKAAHGKARRVPQAMQWAFRFLGRLAPSLMASWAYRLWFTPPRYRAPDRERRYEEAAHRGFLQHDPAPVATYCWGEGAPVLLMHGWGGRGTQLHSFIDPLLERGYQVVALDGPAHGRTAGRRTTAFEFVSALASVNEHFGPFSGVIAHSFGNTAVMLALQEGVLQTERVVAISPPQGFGGVLDKFARILGLPVGVKRRVRRRIEQRFGQDIWDRLSVDTVAPTLTQPALIIHDMMDAEVPMAEGVATARQWPGARFIATRRWGHRRILRAPEVVDAAVAFIADGGKVGSCLSGEAPAGPPRADRVSVLQGAMTLPSRIAPLPRVHGSQ